MQQCNRCKKKLESFDSRFMDYCAFCSRSLCEECILGGCCGRTPARSGREADYDEIAVEPGDEPRRTNVARGTAETGPFTGTLLLPVGADDASAE